MSLRFIKHLATPRSWPEHQFPDSGVSSILTAGSPSRGISVLVTEPLLTGHRLIGSSGATPIYCAAQRDGPLCSSRPFRSRRATAPNWPWPAAQQLSADRLRLRTGGTRDSGWVDDRDVHARMTANGTRRLPIQLIKQALDCPVSQE